MLKRCMKFRYKATHLYLCIVVWLAGCGGLAEEPRIVATFQPPTPVAEIVLPSQTPNLAQGAQVFADHCTDCHGVNGQGDGSLVLSGQLPQAPPDFTDQVNVRADSPVEWFSIITHGRLDRLMPPWGDSLSDQERWAVTMHSYTLRTQPDELTRGQTVWLDQCAACHGETGAGEGLRAGEFASTLLNLAAPDALVEQSDLALLDTFTDNPNHAFGDSLNESERWAVIAYMRGLSLVNVPEPQTVIPDATAEVVYELTDDPSVIVITNLVMQITDEQNSLQVAEIITFRNTSDRIFSGSTIAGINRATSVTIPIPVGAQIVDTASDPQRFVLSSDSSALIDTQPLLPGEDHLVHVIYNLPYDGAIEVPLSYALDGSVRLLVETGNLTVSASSLTGIGAQMMGGVIFEGYSAELSQPASESVSFSITRVAVNNSSTPPTNLLSSVLIALGGLTLLGAAILFYVVRRQPAPASGELREFIIEQIAELDRLYEQTKIDPAAYQDRRTQLKSQLAKLMLRSEKSK